jgi:hypothetical protein
MKNTTKLILIGIIDCVIAVSGYTLMWLAKIAADVGWFKENLPSPYSTITALPYPGITLAISCHENALNRKVSGFNRLPSIRFSSPHILL